MIRMQQTWRWFGPADPVSLQHIQQTGAKGIVTALHQVPHGEVWAFEKVAERKAIIEKAGLNWAVVESITVHESIKTRTGDYKNYIEKYKESIRNVARCGIKIITYNFMPVNDWTRTCLGYKMPDGALALYFDWTDLAVFDIFILERENAGADYPIHIAEAAENRYKNYSAEQRENLAHIIMFGIPGEQKNTVHTMREKLKTYKGMDAAALTDHLCYFLSEVCPVADAAGVQLALHPDDPPFPIFGLPRVASKLKHFQNLMQRVPAASNGICFCTGSLGASPENNVPAMAAALADKIHFAHLRNVRKDAGGNFYESEHLDGDVDMYAVMKTLLQAQQQTQRAIPFRPDHGHQMLDDIHKQTNPGYSAIGRLLGLAELRGLEEGIIRSLKN